MADHGARDSPACGWACHHDGRVDLSWSVVCASGETSFSNCPKVPGAYLWVYQHAAHAPRAQDVAERATSVRAVLSWLDRTPEPVLLLAPEGADHPGGCLAFPPAGVGRFISLLAARGLSILPVAGWEQSGAFRLRFGPPYQLENTGANGFTRDEMDRAVSNVVMRAIAELLPVHLRGEF